MTEDDALKYLGLTAQDVAKQRTKNMTGTALASPFGTGVSLRGNLGAAASALSNAAQRGALGVAPDGSEYLNFSGKRGVYEFGKEKEDIAPDELWLINVESFEEGYVCWKGGSNIAKRMASTYGTPVQEPDSNEHGPFDFSTGEGWKSAKALVCRSLTDENHRQGYFTVNSKSAVAVFASLQEEVANRMEDGRPFWPIVSFSKEKFQAKGNWNSKPTIRIEGWLDTEGVAALGADPEADINALILEADPTAQPIEGLGDEPAAPPPPSKAVARVRRGL